MGEGNEQCTDLTLDSIGNAFCGGITKSFDWESDYLSEPNSTNNSDGLVVAFDPDGAMLWATGMTDVDFDGGRNKTGEVTALTVGSSSKIFVVGNTGDYRETGAVTGDAVPLLVLDTVTGQRLTVEPIHVGEHDFEGSIWANRTYVNDMDARPDGSTITIVGSTSPFYTGIKFNLDGSPDLFNGNTRPELREGRYRPFAYQYAADGTQISLQTYDQVEVESNASAVNIDYDGAGRPAILISASQYRDWVGPHSFAPGYPWPEYEGRSGGAAFTVASGFSEGSLVEVVSYDTTTPYRMQRLTVSDSSIWLSRYVYNTSDPDRTIWRYDR